MRESEVQIGDFGRALFGINLHLTNDTPSCTVQATAHSSMRRSTGRSSPMIPQELGFAESSGETL